MALVALLPLTGCGGSDEADLAVTITEWSIEVEPAATDSGTISMEIDNAGEQRHELVLVVAPDSGALPTLSTAEADLTATVPVDQLEAFEPGRFEASFLRVLPGDYIVLCNLVTEGESHYAKGMAARIEVEATERDQPVTTG